MCGHSSRRRVAADTHQRPTRRFRQLLEPPRRIGAECVSWRAWLFRSCFPPYLVLLRVGFTLPRPLQKGAVSSDGTFWPLPWGWSSRRRANPASRANSGIAVPGLPSGRFRRNGRGVAEAVCFLWHLPSMSLQAHVPDVIRVPLPAEFGLSLPLNTSRERRPLGATARSSCQFLVWLEGTTHFSWAAPLQSGQCFRPESCRI